ncbi:hypothetical protein ACN2XU_12805 [Primorskyibacter sp. 2E107]|uniref:hypothetical protein n=1 Tax=Primorskyibacter sp. 2E107 TaxID=3403458 RepID=UPI003AF46EAD
MSSMNRAVKDRPVLITLKSDLERLERDRDTIAATLLELIEDLEALKNELRAERRAGKSAEGGKLLAEVRYWLKQARETEKEIDAIRRKDSSLAGDWGLDLDAAGDAIGCRLDSLRSCCGANEVS